MSKHRQNTFGQLARMGISRSDAATLVRASATLSTWAEHECNGAIQRDGELQNIGQLNGKAIPGLQAKFVTQITGKYTAARIQFGKTLCMP